MGDTEYDERLWGERVGGRCVIVGVGGGEGVVAPVNVLKLKENGGKDPLICAGVAGCDGRCRNTVSLGLALKKLGRLEEANARYEEAFLLCDELRGPTFYSPQQEGNEHFFIHQNLMPLWKLHLTGRRDKGEFQIDFKMHGVQDGIVDLPDCDPSLVPLFWCARQCRNNIT